MSKEFLAKMGNQTKQSGVTMIEYALIAALVALVAMVALEPAGLAIQALFTKVANTLTPLAN